MSDLLSYDPDNEFVRAFRARLCPDSSHKNQLEQITTESVHVVSETFKDTNYRKDFECDVDGHIDDYKYSEFDLQTYDELASCSTSNPERTANEANIEDGQHQVLNDTSSTDSVAWSSGVSVDTRSEDFEIDQSKEGTGYRWVWTR